MRTPLSFSLRILDWGDEVQDKAEEEGRMGLEFALDENAVESRKSEGWEGWRLECSEHLILLKSK